MSKTTRVNDAAQLYADENAAGAFHFHALKAFKAGWAAAIKEADDTIGALRKFYNVENESDLLIQEALNQAQLEVGDLAK